jgi:hypothetical protein
MTRWQLVLVASVIAVVAGGSVPFFACGGRTELEIDDPVDPLVDGGSDADAPVDAPNDAPDAPDAPPECGPDTEYIYVVSSETELLAYKPESNSFESRGFLVCNATFNATPFSMAVDRRGLAYVVYNDGNLFTVSTEDASCESTPFEVGQLGFDVFGMGFERDPVTKTERLFVAEITFGSPSLGLAELDTKTFELSFIGPFSENPGDALELTPTGEGPLHGYFLDTQGPGGTLVEIDTSDATIVDSTPLDVGMSSSLAVAWYGGAFYIFTANAGGGTVITRHDPVAGTTQPVATIARSIVGAGVSTCAPMIP